MTFKALGLSENILEAIAELGFITPTPVQAKVIPQLLTGTRDLVALAQTGTGKTAAFGLPILEQIDCARKETQALVLCPTRELCMQICRDLTGFAKKIKGLRVVPIYGGASMQPQLAALHSGAHIIVATPGRMHDMLRRKSARLDKVTRVVLDEADEMLDMGFQEDLEVILQAVPKTSQRLLFSATMPTQVARMSRSYMTDPMEITVGAKNTGAENISHECYTVHGKDRYLALKRIADFNPGMYGIVFCRTKIETQEVADQLMHDGYPADSLHGDLSQAQRDRVMQQFRNRNITMLVATDVAARGLDVSDLTHVINYNLPDHLATYTHRSGRTGRAGKAGVSVVILHMRETHVIQRLENLVKKRFTHKQLPSWDNVVEARFKAYAAELREAEALPPELERHTKLLGEALHDLSREDLLKRVASLKFSKSMHERHNARDLNVHMGHSRESSHRPDHASRDDSRGPRERGAPPQRMDEPMMRVLLNAGRQDGVAPPEILALLNRGTRGERLPVGRIDVFPDHSTIDVPESVARQVVDALCAATFGGRKLFAEPARNVKTHQHTRAPEPRQHDGPDPRQHKRPFHHQSHVPRNAIHPGRKDKRPPPKPA